MDIKYTGVNINKERDDKSFMEAERVLHGLNSSTLFLNYRCVGN